MKNNKEWQKNHIEKAKIWQANKTETQKKKHRRQKNFRRYARGQCKIPKGGIEIVCEWNNKKIKTPIKPDDLKDSLEGLKLYKKLVKEEYYKNK